jgi:hypothetical protein
MLTTTKSISYNFWVPKYTAEILAGAFNAKRGVVSVPINRWVCDTVTAYPCVNYLEVYLFIRSVIYSMAISHSWTPDFSRDIFHEPKHEKVKINK